MTTLGLTKASHKILTSSWVFLPAWRPAGIWCWPFPCFLWTQPLTLLSHRTVMLPVCCFPVKMSVPGACFLFLQCHCFLCCSLFPSPQTTVLNSNVVIKFSVTVVYIRCSTLVFQSPVSIPSVRIRTYQFTIFDLLPFCLLIFSPQRPMEDCNKA